MHFDGPGFESRFGNRSQFYLFNSKRNLYVRIYSFHQKFVVVSFVARFLCVGEWICYLFLWKWKDPINDETLKNRQSWVKTMAFSNITLLLFTIKSHVKQFLITSLTNSYYFVRMLQGLVEGLVDAHMSLRSLRDLISSSFLFIFWICFQSKDYVLWIKSKLSNLAKS